ncbi:MAG: superinfection exclusion B family protein [Succinivibrio sp.]|nr:superinfection exclusion B family protein [Succinivibrio sp.]
MDREFNTISETSSLRGLNILMLWLFLVTIIMLAMPWARVSTELAARIDENRMFLYLALVFEASNFISQFIYNFFSTRAQQKAQEQLHNYMERTIEGLDFSERALLREYVLQRKSVLSLPLEEQTVKGLIQSGVLKMVGNEDENGKTPIIISKFARPYITYKSIGLTRGKMTEEQLSQIMDARPEYAREKKAMPKSYRSGGFKVA